MPKTSKREKTLDLYHIFLKNYKVKRYEIPEEDGYAMATEDITNYNTKTVGLPDAEKGQSIR